MPLDQVERLLHSPWHEARLLALLLFIDAYERAGAAGRTDVFRRYLRNAAWINNWDLVDLSAANVVGAHLATRPRTKLDALSRSRSLWERRIAIVATHHFIVNGEFDDTLRIARLLLNDSHDLIHKASGWMLREVGKRDLGPLEAFLVEHAHEMPRTMLRYAIERLPMSDRNRYMAARRLKG
jgi:3-methyladenine DNA glycosylase AlkD